MRVYFTYRPITIFDSSGLGYKLEPHVHLNNSFTGMGVYIEHVTSDFTKDGRGLAFFELPDETDQTIMQDKKAAVVEAMSLFSYHEKTANSALQFAKLIGHKNAGDVDGKIVLDTVGAPIYGA